MDIISSRFETFVELYFKIFVTAEMAFSVGLTFSGSLLPGAIINSIKFGITWAHTGANWVPPNYEFLRK